MYVHDIQNKTCLADGTPTVVKDSPSTALVDGQNLLGQFDCCNRWMPSFNMIVFGSCLIQTLFLGPVVGHFAMDLAIRKAKETGVGWIAAKGTNNP